MLGNLIYLREKLRATNWLMGFRADGGLTITDEGGSDLITSVDFVDYAIELNKQAGLVIDLQKESLQNENLRRIGSEVSTQAVLMNCPADDVLPRLLQRIMQLEREAVDNKAEIERYCGLNDTINSSVARIEAAIRMGKQHPPCGPL